MGHLIHQVKFFEQAGPYTLRIGFEDATEQVIDFEPILAGEIYGPLRDQRVFNQVKLDPEVGTLVWPNGADFDPSILHDWPERKAAFQRLTQTWTAVHR